MEKTYDSQCKILAEHFLQDYTSTMDQVEDLSQAIQGVVEDWFEENGEFLTK